MDVYGKLMLSHSFLIACTVVYRLTAYVLKYLHATATSQWVQEVYVPTEVMNKMALWITSVQHSSGAWFEPSGLYYNMNYYVST
jgi:hypothetical protein